MISHGTPVCLSEEWRKQFKELQSLIAFTRVMKNKSQSRFPLSFPHLLSSYPSENAIICVLLRKRNKEYRYYIATLPLKNMIITVLIDAVTRSVIFYGTVHTANNFIS